MEEKQIHCDILVVGGGTAGCFAALTARTHGLDVLVVDKAASGQSGASIMASGFWAVFNEDWGMDYDETLSWICTNGAGLNNQDWVRAFLNDSWGTFLDLKKCGVQFPVADEDLAGFFRASIVGDDQTGHHEDDPHTHYGIVPLTHRSVTPVLRRYAQAQGVRFLDRVMVTDLIVQNGRVQGAVGFPMEEEVSLVFDAGAVILTAGRGYFRSPGMNISGQTGESEAMAYRAGAVLSGKEFPDMHINVAKDPMWKGNGEMYPAYFQFDDAFGRRIPNKGFDLTMASVIHAGQGPIYWDFGKATANDLRSIQEYLAKRNNRKEVERAGIDPNSGRKYPMIGGAAGGGCQEQATGLWTVDATGASTLPGLYSAGDCCCSWMWGAIVQGPPPGLSPAAVQGKRAARAAVDYVRGADRPALDRDSLSAALAHLHSYADRRSGFSPRWITQLLQNYMMPYYILHIKERARLEATLTLVEYLRQHMVPKLYADDLHMLRLAHETESMVLNAEMILRASLFRTESRGWHFREDYPLENDNQWLAWNQIFQGADGSMCLSKRPVDAKWLPKLPLSHPARWLAWEHPEQGGT